MMLGVSHSKGDPSCLFTGENFLLRLAWMFPSKHFLAIRKMFLEKTADVFPSFPRTCMLSTNSQCNHGHRRVRWGSQTSTVSSAAPGAVFSLRDNLRVLLTVKPTVFVYSFFCHKKSLHLFFSFYHSRPPLGKKKIQRLGFSAKW